MEEGNTSGKHLTSAAAFVEGGIQEACDDACSICLEDFSESDPSTVTSCKHEFHLQCILEWCQRSSQCPMCWQPISLKDPGSQELLDAVERERNIRMNPPRTTTIFRHPTLGDFELQHLPVGAGESELEERIIQHLAAAAAMGRARQLARREGQRNRSTAQGRPQILVFSTNPNAPSPTGTGHSADQRNDSDPPQAIMTGPDSPFGNAGEVATPPAIAIPSAQEDMVMTSASGSNASASQIETSSSSRSPPQTHGSQGRGGSSDLQSFSESVKSRISAWSTRYKESITKSTRSWKEKLFNRNNPAPETSAEVGREVEQGIIAPMSRLMDHLEISDYVRTNRATEGNSNADGLEGHVTETDDRPTNEEHGTWAPCAASSAPN